MKIAVNTRLLLHNRLEGIGWFTFETLKRITAAHPEHEFIYIFDRKHHPSFITSQNITPLEIGPPARHPLLWKIWFDFSLPMALRKHQPDVFLSPDGFLSSSLKIPQLAVIHDLNFELYPKDLRRSHSRYYRENMPRFAQLAKRIATVSEFSKNDLITQYHTDPLKIDVVYNGVNSSFRPAESDAINAFRNEFTGGADYFLFVGAMHPRKNIQRLLGAFELLKNKAPGNYKLVLAGNKYWWHDDIRKQFEAMKHKSDVVFTGRIPGEMLNTALSGATALTFVPYFEGFGIPILEAFATGCPVITSNITAMPEVAGNAALFADPFSEESISEAMKKLLNNPELAGRLKIAGEERLKHFSWDQTAARLWHSIEKTLE